MFDLFVFFYIIALPSSLDIPSGKGMAHIYNIHWWTKRYRIVNKAVCSTKESTPSNDELESWKETVLYHTLARYSPQDIDNGDKTALFYKCLPHRTYCIDGGKPAGSAKHKDRHSFLPYLLCLYPNHVIYTSFDVKTLVHLLNQTLARKSK